MTVSDAPAVAGPHIAQRAQEAHNGEGQGAQRAGAREGTASAAQVGRTTTAQSTPTFGDWIEGVWARWLGWVTPPDIWAADRPSLSKVWAHATRGDWARPGGATRWAARFYAGLVALPVAAVCKYIEWLTERSSRLAAVVVLVVVLAQFPPVSWLI